MRPDSNAQRITNIQIHFTIKSLSHNLILSGFRIIFYLHDRTASRTVHLFKDVLVINPMDFRYSGRKGIIRPGRIDLHTRIALLERFIECNASQIVRYGNFDGSRDRGITCLLVRGGHRQRSNAIANSLNHGVSFIIFAIDNHLFIARDDAVFFVTGLIGKNRHKLRKIPLSIQCHCDGAHHLNLRHRCANSDKHCCRDIQVVSIGIFGRSRYLVISIRGVLPHIQGGRTTDRRPNLFKDIRIIAQRCLISGGIPRSGQQPRDYHVSTTKRLRRLSKVELRKRISNRYGNLFRDSSITCRNNCHRYSSQPNCRNGGMSLVVLTHFQNTTTLILEHDIIFLFASLLRKNRNERRKVERLTHLHHDARRGCRDFRYGSTNGHQDSIADAEVLIFHAISQDNNLVIPKGCIILHDQAFSSRHFFIIRKDLSLLALLIPFQFSLEIPGGIFGVC